MSSIELLMVSLVVIWSLGALVCLAGVALEGRREGRGRPEPGSPESDTLFDERTGELVTPLPPGE